LLEAALRQLSAERGFSSLSLREVAREAGIAPTSFYRHFADLDSLGMALVDEAGESLRRLMREARKHTHGEVGVIRSSVETFMEFLGHNAELFYLLSRERAVGSECMRDAIRREVGLFIDDLATDLTLESQARSVPVKDIPLVAEAMVTIVFNEGLEALDAPPRERRAAAERMIRQLRMIALGAEAMAQRELSSPELSG
jgi:AcrR family transcriptional regulator